MATPRERHPDMFEPLGTESPRGKAKTVPLECMNLSFMRCGTTSMHVAMQMLGLKSWHSVLFMSTCFGYLDMWEEASLRKYFGAGKPFGRQEFDQLLHDFGAVSSDIPALAFTEDLIKAYPEAKVVLVERDIDKWYESYENTIIRLMVSLYLLKYYPSSRIALTDTLSEYGRKISVYSPQQNGRLVLKQDNRFSKFNRLIYYIDPFFCGPIGRCQFRCIEGWLGAYTADDMRKNAKKAYREHYQLVRRLVPKEKLLEFKLEEGWEPLCKFLNKPVPDKPFPRLNDLDYVNERMTLFNQRAVKGVLRHIVQYGFPVIICAAGVAYYYSKC